ncbi:biotin--[acetyl-CoA-carboxylase] ligase [Novosphingobium album (ex Liu et al. 2023)]|uniref:biotin--[biotin carboxyl-carrier protein] ligase n=1 Tax=Novosphingobium album (ex Liu et al. 2023) TaxID=3031130 RepID=A0ABT5WW91_9SPHN|nr:biotin--[acetyl-CoA-carboxylase] ligase [Novosphingobium album (ex Liu et al. 2023)]MDE8654175.1 biotin--[acetyl-CoA-carboxylase] ligase [Novosphingobium album (ex Liu et al. 2023)]
MPHNSDGPIRFVAETGSTNADLAARIAAGDYLAEGDWLVADRQRAGRGRRGREWHDGAGNFMGSTVVRLGHGDPAAATLALMTGLAVREAVAPHLPDRDMARLKWPNDLMLGAAKLAGVLLERVGDTVIIGIGVNLVSAPALPDRPAAALADFAPAPDRDSFAHDLARAFAAELERWRAAGIAPLLRRWQAAAHPEGTPLAVQPPGEPALSGGFAGLDAEGNLRLRLPDGGLRAISAGDVLLAESR